MQEYYAPVAGEQGKGAGYPCTHSLAPIALSL